MFTRFENSWQLVKASAKVLQEDKKLIVFPIVSFILSIIVLISFAIPTAMAGLFDAMASSGRHGENARVYGTIIGFLYYLVMYFVVIYCNTALVGAVMIKLKGGTPTLSDGFKVANSRLASIFGYAAISATVGMILRAISERSGLVGRIVVSIIGFVWSVATFLVVPILVVENLNPIDAVKRSAELLKKTWGEQLAVNFGVGAVFGLLTLLVIFGGGALVVGLLSVTKSAAIALIAIPAIILAVIALSLVSSALQGIFVAALYLYATQGNTGGIIDESLAQSAFRQR